MNDKYSFTPTLSILPNQISLYNTVLKRNLDTDEFEPIKKRKSAFVVFDGDMNVVSSNSKKFHDFKLSENATRTMRKKINWLFYLSKPKSIRTIKGTNIYNFRTSFVTLTLPSEQTMPTTVLNDKLLNNFLTEVRRQTGMTNYVWRLEFQKNLNAHWHLVSDTYLDYFLIRNIWNRLLKKEGLILEYHNKFKDMTLSDYVKLRNKDKATPYDVCCKDYAKGKSQNWQNPNSVSVESIINSNNISAYISKYFGKNQDEITLRNPHDNEENSKNIRLWFCSRSLSKLDSFKEYKDVIVFPILDFLEKTKGVKKVNYDYCTSFYYKISDLQIEAQVFLNETLAEKHHYKAWLE
jgi:hypothetical protein